MNNPLSEEMIGGNKAFKTLTLSDISDRLASAKHALVLCHINPDGDTVGSAYALCEIIKGCGGDAEVACSSEVPKRLKFLENGEGTLLPANVVREKYDLIFSVDAASPGQLGELDVLIPDISFMIDHHGAGEAFAENYIDSAASAAGEIVAEIYELMKKSGKIRLCTNAARRAYAAIVSDTGSFKFSNTTPKTLKIAADLLEEINSADDGGADTADICRTLFGQRTYKELIAQMVAIQNLAFLEEGRLGIVMFTTDMIEAEGLSEEDIGNIVEVARAVEGVEVGISIRQLSDNPDLYKVSSRANVDIDVSAVCALFGGGGHVRAAGCTVKAENPEKALELISGAFGEAVRNNKKP